MALPFIIGALTIIGSVLWEVTKVSAETLYKLVSVMSTHPLLAYFLILFLLFIDSATFGVSGFGLIGGAITGVLNNLFNVPIVINSFELLVILTIFPVLIFVLSKSRQLQSR